MDNPDRLRRLRDPARLRRGRLGRRTRARLSALLLVLATAVLLPGTPAWAHAQLLSSSPERDTTLKQPPAAITLVFSEKLNPDFTTIVLSDAARRPVTAGPPEVDGRKGTVEPAAPLGNGSYTVAYRVVSVDGHTVQGSYVFTVDSPAASTAAWPAAVSPSAPSTGVASGQPAQGTAGASSSAAAAGPAPGALTADDGVPVSVLAGIGVVVLLLLAGGGYLWLAARRRSA